MTQTSTGIDVLRFHRFEAGFYSNIAGHRVFRMEPGFAGRIPGLDWRLIDPSGEWMGDHSTLTSAQESIR